MNDKKGILTIISGFSGAGKGTVVEELLKTHSEDFCLSISATTRKPRSHEINGKHYFFLSREEFEDRIAKDGFLEYAEYVGNYYGTPKDFVLNKLEAGISVVLEIEIQGALQVKERYPEAVLIFITPPTAEELESRLRGRGTETEEVIANRLSRAAEEVVYMENYEYIVLNEKDQVEKCVSDIYHIIETEKTKACYNRNLMTELKEGLARYHKEGE